VSHHQQDRFQSDTASESQPSKTRRKQAMHALQTLGERLIELEPGQIAELELPENLTDALLAARKITSHGARRRQIQFIGKLMRTVDPLPVQEKLDRWQSSGLQHTARLHQLERWRDRLLQDEAAVTEFVQRYPQTDIRQLRNLLRNIEKERLAGKPPASFRALFQLLRRIIPETPG